MDTFSVNQYRDNYGKLEIIDSSDKSEDEGYDNFKISSTSGNSNSFSTLVSPDQSNKTPETQTISPFAERKIGNSNPKFKKSINFNSQNEKSMNKMSIINESNNKLQIDDDEIIPKMYENNMRFQRQQQSNLIPISTQYQNISNQVNYQRHNLPNKQQINNIIQGPQEFNNEEWCKEFKQKMIQGGNQPFENNSNNIMQHHTQTIEHHIRQVNQTQISNCSEINQGYNMGIRPMANINYSTMVRNISGGADLNQYKSFQRPPILNPRPQFQIQGTLESQNLSHSIHHGSLPNVRLTTDQNYLQQVNTQLVNVNSMPNHQIRLTSTPRFVNNFNENQYRQHQQMLIPTRKPNFINANVYTNQIPRSNYNGWNNFQKNSPMTSPLANSVKWSQKNSVTSPTSCNLVTQSTKANTSIKLSEVSTNPKLPKLVINTKNVLQHTKNKKRKNSGKSNSKASAKISRQDNYGKGNCTISRNNLNSESCVDRYNKGYPCYCNPQCEFIPVLPTMKFTDIIKHVFKFD